MSGGGPNAGFSFWNLPNELVSLIRGLVAQFVPNQPATYLGRNRVQWAYLATHWPPGLQQYRDEALMRAWWEIYGPTTNFRPNLPEGQLIVPVIWAWMRANRGEAALWSEWSMDTEYREQALRINNGSAERDYAFDITLRDDARVFGEVVALIRGPTQTWYQDPPNPDDD